MGFAIRSRHVLMGATGLGVGLAVSDRKAATPTMSSQQNDKPRLQATAQRLETRRAVSMAQPSSARGADASWVRTARTALRRIQVVERALGYNLAGTPLAQTPTDKMTFEQLLQLADDAEAFLQQRQNRWRKLEYALKVYENPHGSVAPAKPRSLGHAYRSAVAMEHDTALGWRTRGQTDTYFV